MAEKPRPKKAAAKRVAAADARRAETRRRADARRAASGTAPVKKAAAKKTAAAQKRAERVPAATRRQATTMARQGGYTDANFDFIPDKDKLTRKELAAQYQSAVGVIYSVPELKGVFEQAINEGWTNDRMIAAVQNSDWYRNNNEYARVAWAQEQTGGADWKVGLENARSAVQQAATAAGASLTPAEADALARRYIYEGWGEDGRQGFLMQALSQEITYLPDDRGNARLVGGAGELADGLRQLAYANGMNYSDSFYLSAAQSVAAGLTTAEDWERDMREQAASLWPVYGDKIRAGVNVFDLASPYIQTMSQEFEISPNDINLGDPYIREALTGVDDQGNPVAMGLWDFQKKLRKDPRWMNTAKAQNEVTGVAGRIMQMFGVLGG